MKALKDLIKGFLIGIANIIPGVSGGTVAVLTGAYDVIITSLSDIIKHPLKSIKNVIMLVIGLIIGILFGLFTIGSFFLPLFPLQMSFLFAGLIIGAIKPIVKEAFAKKPDILWIFIFVISFISLIVMSLIKILVKDQGFDLSFDLINCIIAFLLGLIASIAMIIPGFSGSILLLALGYYQTVINLLTTVIKELLEFKFTTNLIIILMFGIGCIVGILFISKVINYLLKKHRFYTYSAIFGLILSSIVAVIMLGINNFVITDQFVSELGSITRNISPNLVFIEYVTAVITLVIGAFLGGFMMKLNKEELNFNDLASKYSDEALKSLMDLVSVPSVLDESKATKENPFGPDCTKALELALKMGKDLGFEAINDDNYAGEITYGNGEESVGILGHLDVVPAVGKWTNDPFEPTIRDGKLYARGTLDDKGGVIASLYALKLLKDNGFNPKRKVRIIMGCDEESGSRCLEYHFKKVKEPTMAFSPDADFPVIYGEKGIYTFDLVGKIDNPDILEINGGLRYNIVIDNAKVKVKNPNQSYLDEFLAKNPHVKATLENDTYTFFGKAAHAMKPQEGINAAAIMFDFINEYYPCNASKFITNYFDTTGNKLGCDLDDPEMHQLTINLGKVSYDGKDLLLGYNLRVPTDEHVEVIRKSFTDNALKFNLKIGRESYSPRLFVSKDSFLVSNLMKAYQEVTGDYETKPFTIGGGTYARMMDNAVAFGLNLPGRPDICHEPDEHIYLEDFEKWIAIYAKAIYLLAK